MFKKFIKILSVIVVFGAAFFPFITEAETHVTTGVLSEGARWTQSGSPYILEDYVYLPSSQRLIIEPGVTILTGSTTEEGQDPYSMTIQGDLIMEGTKENPIKVFGLGTVYISYSTTSIKHALFQGTGIEIQESKVTIASSNIFGAGDAISSKKTILTITGSEIYNNERGIVSNLWSSGPVLSLMGFAEGDEPVEEEPEQSIIKINNSVIEGNTVAAIRNRTSNVIDASDNWWGSAEGPNPDAISGPVMVEPWKTKDPRTKVAQCCSNVLFLPGLKASRLYKIEMGNFGTSTNTLWEPNRNEDVRKLYMTDLGNSISPSIFTKDVLDSAFGIENIYKGFIAMMNGVVADKKINEWLSFPYDWRDDVTKVATEDVRYSTTTKKLVTELEKLALNSKTGKVSIVSHSNGGLVLKALGKELEKQGKLELLDKVVFVAVPQFGTPQAIAALLHGADEALLGGAVLKASVARTLGLSMPGGYGLIPSPAYFDRSISPIVSFATSTLSSYASMVDFLTGKIMKRSQAEESNTEAPALLSKTLITKALTTHESLDTWNFPDSIKKFFISGWGKYTTEGVKYLKDEPSLVKTLLGDGTVVSRSSKGNGLDTLFFNQAEFNKTATKEIKHANILEASPIQNALSQILTKNTASVADITLPQHITKEEPSLENYPSSGTIAVSVHSPVDIDVYDGKGGHIGLIPLKDKAPAYPDSDLTILENTLGGTYEDIGGHKYVYLPTGSGETYSVALKGIGVGTFTFQIQKFDNSMKEIASTTYADLPVTPLLVASTTVTATSIKPNLNLDVDGNGKTDMEVKPNTPVDPLLHIESMKKVIISLKLKPLVEKSLLLRLEVMKVLIKSGKASKWLTHMKNLPPQTLISSGKHWTTKNLTEENKKMITDMFTTLLDSIGAR